MAKASLPVAWAAALLIGAAACSPGAAVDGRLRVVAAFYPLQFVAEQVGGEHTTVTSLTAPGVDAHDVELHPSQVVEVSQAELVLYLSGFQPAVDAAVAEHAGEAGFDVGTVPGLLNDAAPAPDSDHHDHDHDHGHDHGHQSMGPDPHVWLDPLRFADLADAVADRLATLDPTHAADYRAGAARLRDELTALDQEFTEGLTDCQRREIVVSHAAFGYLAHRYDLRQVAVTGLSPEVEPTPGQLAEVITQAKAHGATTIFFERLASPAVADVIAAEVGAESAVLDPIEGLAPDSDDDYVALMRANLAALRSALECS